MGIANAIAKVAGNMLRANVFNYIALEDAIDDHTFVCKDGSLVTLLEVSGMKQIPGREEFERARTKLIDVMMATMGEPGHEFTWSFMRDKEQTRREIEHAIAGSRKTIRALNLDLDDMLDETVDVMSQNCVHESNLIAVWTNLSALEADVLEMDKKRKKGLLAKIPFVMSEGINPFVFVRELLTRHEGYMRLLLDRLQEADLIVNKVEAHDAARRMRVMFSADLTSLDWNPVLSGDKYHFREPEEELPARDVSDFLYPRLDWQIGRAEIEEVETGVVRVGDTYYAPILVELWPQEVRRFEELFRSLPNDLPYRFTFHVRQGIGSDVGVKSMMLSFLRVLHTENRIISRGLEEVTQRQLEEGVSASLSGVVVTWAKDLDECRRRMQVVARSVQAWGQIDTMFDGANPAESLLSSVPGLTRQPVATPGYPPVEDIATMMPVSRPANIWQTGAVLFNTRDGKLWPYDPGSSKQTTWIDLVFAKPGAGKSVLSQIINMALSLRAGIKRLPRVSILDIGPSSQGLIRLLRESLPENLRHQVVGYQMQMRKGFFINPMDLPLGLRAPLSAHRELLVSILSILLTPVGRDRPYENMVELIKEVIDQAYAYYADEKSAKSYSPRINEVVDKAIEEYVPKHALHENPSWYEVADALFDAGRPREAQIAQRYAVPLLSDLTTICQNSPSIQSMYGSTEGREAIKAGDTNETLINAFTRLISQAIKDYPLFAGPTTFDLEGARIIALDLQSVCPSGSESADRQTAVMYMLGRYLVAGDFYMNDGDLPNWPEKYRHYWQRIIREIQEDDKRIVFDEFHRTGKSFAVREAVVRDMREGRKWGVQIALLSQDVGDFDKIMVSLATNIFIMGGGNAADIQAMKELFNLTETEVHLLESGAVHGPKAGGSAFLYRFETKEGWHSQLLKNPRGPRELWAYSTTKEDARLLNYLSERIGFKESLGLLAREFPGGSAKSEIERRLAAQVRDDEFIDDKASQSVINDLADELIQRYHENLRKQKQVA